MGLQTLEAGEKELNRLRKLKLERMGDLILTARTKIQGKSPEERHACVSAMLFAGVATYPGKGDNVE